MIYFTIIEIHSAVHYEIILLNAQKPMHLIISDCAVKNENDEHRQWEKCFHKWFNRYCEGSLEAVVQLHLNDVILVDDVTQMSRMDCLENAAAAVEKPSLRKQLFTENLVIENSNGLIAIVRELSK